MPSRWRCAGGVLLRAAPEPSLDDVTAVASYYPVFRIIYEQQT
ncbi:MAG TPA: hypothetical protein VHN80_30040 [Kineosporiaceae bacterium]|nr:hypothetical protein [Kineosporiaceae bacterium]